VSFTIHLSSRELRSVQAALRLAQIEYQTFVSGPFGGEQPLSLFELGDLLVRIDGVSDKLQLVIHCARSWFPRRPQTEEKDMKS
jgi:hypothetical protein